MFFLLKVKDLYSYSFFNFLSWRKFVSSVGCILLPQLAVFCFLSWLKNESAFKSSFSISIKHLPTRDFH